jgi:hypothetical protein
MKRGLPHQRGSTKRRRPGEAERAATSGHIRSNEGRRVCDRALTTEEQATATVSPDEVKERAARNQELAQVRLGRAEPHAEGCV